jgi:hypothetical protein
MFPHRNFWTSGGKTHRQFDYILNDKGQYSGIIDDRSFRGADCDIDHCLVVAEVRQRWSVSKRTAHKFDRRHLISES